jgi:large subunit ribosomal protein L21
MYAIVDIAGKQIRVEKDQIIKVPYISQDVGALIELDRILLLDDDKNVKIGQPMIKGVKVSAKILEHGKDSKVIILKRKRRKGHKKKMGHRQDFSKIQIKKIV